MVIGSNDIPKYPFYSPQGDKKARILPLFARGGGGGRRFRLKYSFESLKEYTIVLNPRQAGGREEGVIQISYNWSPLLIYIANFTSHNFQQPLYRGREAVWYHSL